MDEKLHQLQQIEQRYAWENRIMDAVSQGDHHRLDGLLPGMSALRPGARLSDPVRDLKNYCIIMNTLLRKAAEEGGVHPVYLDAMSRDFALRIEALSDAGALRLKMREMMHAYCRLVKKQAARDYSPPVRKVIAYINADLAGDLNLRSLSGAMNISGSYLSTLFKKETGMTLTEFITRQRIAYAARLLKTTRLQVQAVAQQCGILDVHYFSRVFKKITGKTPRQYREQC